MLSEKDQLGRLVQQWNENRLDLFHLSAPTDDLEIQGVMRFYFPDTDGKVCTKCIRVSSTATTRAVISALIEKFIPDLKMLSDPEYSLWEVHEGGEERRLDPEEKPLLVQLTWHKDDREGRFLLKRHGNQYLPLSALQLHDEKDNNIKRGLKRFSKREKKEVKKKHQSNIVSVNAGREEETILGSDIYIQVPPTTFTRTISNPEIVMKKRREKKLEAKLNEMGHGGSLKIYGADLNPSRPYVTLLVGLKDRASNIVKETLEKYGMEHLNPVDYVLVESSSPPDYRRSLNDLHRIAQSDDRPMDDDECPLIAMANRESHSPEMFYSIKQRPTSHYKKISNGNGWDNRSITSQDNKSTDPAFLLLNTDGSFYTPECFLSIRNGVTEVGSDQTLAQFSPQNIFLHGNGIRGRHCVITFMDGVATITPSASDSMIEVSNHRIVQTAILSDGDIIRMGTECLMRYVHSQSRFVALRPNSHLDSASLQPRMVHYGSTTPTTPLTSRRTIVPQIPQSTFEVHAHKVYSPGMRGGMVHARPSRTMSRAYSMEAISSGVLKNMLSGSSLASSSRQTSEQMDSSLPPPIYNGHGMGQGPPHGTLHNQGPPISLQIGDYRVWDFLMEVMSRGCEESPSFRLSPAFSLYLALRFFHTHSKPYLVQFMTRIAVQIGQKSQECESREELLFWLANSSELTYLIDNDGDLSALTAQRGGAIGPSVERVLRRLVAVVRKNLDNCALRILDGGISDEESTAETLSLLDSTLRCARSCRLNAALTIQLSSQLFHSLNAKLFNSLVTNTENLRLSQPFGRCLSARLHSLHQWAERMGLELAAECHLDRIQQAVNLLAASKDDVAAMGSTCYKLNSIQIRHLLSNYEVSEGEHPLDNEVVNAVIGLAERQADELTIQEGESVVLEESDSLTLPFLLPQDGYAAEQLTGVPEGLLAYVLKLQAKGLCHSVATLDIRAGWLMPQGSQSHQVPTTPTVPLNEVVEPQPQRQQLHNGGQGSLHSVMTGSNFGDSIGSSVGGGRAPSSHSLEDTVRITLRRGPTGIGLSIVAAQGVGDRQVGIYVKKVVDGGPASVDGRLAAGDQLLSVSGLSLIGISQEEAASRMGRVGQELHFEVRKGAALNNGLAAWLCQTTPISPNAPHPSHLPTLSHPPSPSASLISSSQQMNNYALINKGAHGQGGGGGYTQKQQAPSNPRSSAFSPLSSLPQSSQQTQADNGGGARHQRSISASELYQHDPNASFSQRSICSNVSGFATGSHNLPPHYRSANQRPTVIQPGRQAQSPSALRRGAQSPSNLYRPPSANSLHHPTVSVQQQQPQQLPLPPQQGVRVVQSGNRMDGGMMSGQVERPNQLGAQQQNGVHRQSAQSSSVPEPVFRASSSSHYLHTSPPVSQSSPRQSSSIRPPLPIGDQYANLPLHSNPIGFPSRNESSHYHSLRDFQHRGDPPSIPSVPSSSNQQPFSYTGGAPMFSRSLKEPAVVRPLDHTSTDMSQSIDFRQSQSTTTFGVGRGGVPTAISQVMQQGAPRPLKPSRVSVSELDRDVRNLEHTTSSIMGGQDVSAELDRLDAKGINMTERETQRYRQLLDMNAEMRSVPPPVPRRQETVIDDVINDSGRSEERSPLRDPSNPRVSPRRSVQFSEVIDTRDEELLDSPSIVGAQEVYRDPRQRRLNEIQSQQGTQQGVDGSNLGFRDKMRLFASQLGEGTPKDKAKESSAQRHIEAD